MLAMRMHNNKTQWSDKVVQHQNEGDQLWILPSWHFAQTSLEARNTYRHLYALYYNYGQANTEFSWADCYLCLTWPSE